MPTAPPFSPQLDLLPGLSPASGDVLARYEALRPILQGQRTLKQQSQATGLPYKRLWRDLQRFRRDGLAGLRPLNSNGTENRVKPFISQPTRRSGYSEMVESAHT